MQLSRRDAIKAFATGAAAVAGAAAFGGGAAHAAPGGLGTLVDYSAGIPSPASIREAGHKGVIRYCSEARAPWMAKPMRADEAAAMHAAGLAVVSCYQYGKDETSDWHGGFDAGVQHARRGLELHRAAGGPADRPIYMSIDSNPSRQQFDTQVLPFLQGCESVLGHAGTGIYANAPTIDWAIAAGLGAYFWQHNWGSDGRVHPAAHIHQTRIDKDKIDGIGVDLNSILKADYGQWSTAGAPAASPAVVPAATSAPAPAASESEQRIAQIAREAVQYARSTMGS